MAQTRTGTSRRPPPPRRGAPPRGPQGRRGRPAERGPQWGRVLIPVFLVVAIILGLVIAKVAGGGGSNGSTSVNAGAPAPAGVTDALAGIPASTFSTVGVPSAVSAGPVTVKPPPAVLTANGLPQIVYEGAEYCPYCATERWPLTVALDRFGSFTGLKTTSSSATDVYPSTQTLSYHGATYTSPYIVFTSVEETTNQPSGGGYQTLETPTALENQLAAKYDQPPYISTQGAIPFIDIGNHYIVSTTYSPQVLQGKTASGIVSALSNPSDPITQGVIGSANVITAAICQITNNQPASVCSGPEIQAAKSHFT